MELSFSGEAEFEYRDEDIKGIGHALYDPSKSPSYNEVGRVWPPERSVKGLVRLVDRSGELPADKVVVGVAISSVVCIRKSSINAVLHCCGH